jgi:hypothetical protein
VTVETRANREENVRRVDTPQAAVARFMRCRVGRSPL